MEFHKAERKKAKLRLALTGPSGSGKTFSALLIAKGIGGKVAMIDTESGSGELYAENSKIGMEYDVMEFTPPYSPERAIQAVKTAHSEGYNVVIFDSLSHIWMGEGGLLEMVDTASKGLRGNSFAAWKEVRPFEKKFLEALTRTDIHIIATMRTKTDWSIEKDEKTGKSHPVKIGLKPEQREGLDYEFTVVFDLNVDGNVASVSKDRTDLFKGKFFTPSAQTGKELLVWLNKGKKPFNLDDVFFQVNTVGSVEDLKSIYDKFMEQAKSSGQYDEFNRMICSRKKELEKQPSTSLMITDAQRNAIMTHYKSWSREDRLKDMSAFLKREVDSFNNLTKDEASEFIEAINTL